MEYKVVYAQGEDFDEAAERLTMEVNKLLKEGWVLQGGVAQSITKYEWHFMSQAMVKMSARNEICKL